MLARMARQIHLCPIQGMLLLTGLLIYFRPVFVLALARRLLHPWMRPDWPPLLSLAMVRVVRRFRSRTSGWTWIAAVRRIVRSFEPQMMQVGGSVLLLWSPAAGASEC